MILPGLSQGSVLLWVCLLLVSVLTAVSLTHKLLMSAASILKAMEASWALAMGCNLTSEPFGHQTACSLD
jgi:cytochrome c biogenesis factor